MCDHEGKPFDPQSLPDEQADDAMPNARREAPIGRPMAPEEYARMKGEAAAVPDPPKRSGQEDPNG